ncbi:MAG TPA: thiamine pyrophosphate-binding protein [Polyangiaceae bacterium]|nr:thiamine pyrophosphate-binding protein [Polyangiaceae bacterium]
MMPAVPLGLAGDRPVSGIQQLIAPKSLADQLVQGLANCGISTYFGVPGGAIEPLFNALAREQSLGRVEVILMRSEAGAAFAADGYYRATRRIAACTTTTGPGVTNLTTAVMAAYSDRIPILLITPQAPMPRQGRGAFQDSCADAIDVVKVLESCTRYSTTVVHPSQLHFRLSRAVHLARTPPTGPVHVSIPSDLLAGPPEQGAPLLQLNQLPASTPVDELACLDLVNAVTSARFPVFYIGDDAGLDAQELCAVARQLGAAVVSSPAGKRWISHKDPIYAGVVGFAGHQRAASAIRHSDLVVTFGATFDEFSTNAWNVFDGRRVFSVDRHGAYAYRQPGARVVIAETYQVVERLRSAMPSVCPSRIGLSSYPPPTLVRSNGDAPVHPLDLMRWLNLGVPDDVVVHVDTGSSMAWSTRELVRPVPDTYRVAMGACSMCWAISAAIGAAIATHERVICLTGDGAMLMSSLELTVAAEQNLPVTYLILNDSSLGMVRHGQRLAGAENIATRLAPVRFDLLAQACGVEAIRVDCRTSLARVPAEWLSCPNGGPRLIDVVIDPNAVPPIGQRIAALNLETSLR